MVENQRNIQGIIKQMERFHSPELSKKTSLFLLKGEESGDSATSRFTVIMFPFPEEDRKIDMVLLASKQDIAEYLSTFNKLSEPDSLRYLKPKATPTSQIKSMSFARKEGLPFAVIFAGHSHKTNEMVAMLNILKGVNPKVIYQIFREKCQEQLARLN